MKTLSTTFTDALTARLADYAQLVKLRLSAVVVFSAVAGYAVAVGANLQVLDALLLGLGGLLITSAANAMNEFIERDTDKLMARTADRPLPSGRMGMLEAVMLAGLMAVSGLLLIGVYFNELAGFVGAVALISYAFIYTPLKKAGPIAVWIGAVPGALPPVIGYVCAVGGLDERAVVLFAIQFIWQFIHFWSIAWLADADYARAGFRLLPASTGKSRGSAGHVVVFAVILFFGGGLPWLIGMSPGWVSVCLLIIALPVVYCAAMLFKHLSDSAARRLMLASFVYLPLALILTTF
jgi:protoheme IX farnesyltransferase